MQTPFNDVFVEECSEVNSEVTIRDGFPSPEIEGQHVAQQVEWIGARLREPAFEQVQSGFGCRQSMLKVTEEGGGVVPGTAEACRKGSADRSYHVYGRSLIAAEGQGGGLEHAFHGAFWI